jgi:hypothetical protein
MLTPLNVLSGAGAGGRILVAGDISGGSLRGFSDGTVNFPSALGAAGSLDNVAHPTNGTIIACYTAFGQLILQMQNSLGNVAGNFSRLKLTGQFQVGFSTIEMLRTAATYTTGSGEERWLWDASDGMATREMVIGSVYRLEFPLA